MKMKAMKITCNKSWDIWLISHIDIIHRAHKKSDIFHKIYIFKSTVWGAKRKKNHNNEPHNPLRSFYTPTSQQSVCQGQHRLTESISPEAGLWIQFFHSPRLVALIWLKKSTPYYLWVFEFSFLLDRLANSHKWPNPPYTGWVRKMSQASYYSIILSKANALICYIH